MSEQEKLLPCPFCGGEASRRGGPYMTRKLIMCNECEAERDTAEQWNTRPQPSIEGDVVERVARELYRGMTDDDDWDIPEDVSQLDIDIIENNKGVAREMAKKAIDAMQPAIDKAVAEERARFVSHYETFYAVHEWHEDDGNVLWWRLPVCEPPYCGTPDDSDFPHEWATHFTHIVRNSVIRTANEAIEQGGGR